MAEPENDTSEFEQNVELFSDYYEGSLNKDKTAKLDALIQEEARYAEAYEDFKKTMEMLSGMHKMSAPVDFEKKVEDTIHRRSGGRFFGRRAFGERIPYEILAILAMLLGGAIYWMGRTSGTGGHKLHEDQNPRIEDAHRDVVPRL